MNRRQWNIVKIFLDMGEGKLNSPEKVAKAFKADVKEVRLVAMTYNFDQFDAQKRGEGLDFLEGVVVR